ncbi:ATP-binding protein [Acinetobacter bereziniae]|uniref:AAA family ATPase n=1 Tax=Acinetobacter bereziniae TaxID=106648 RepID=UPI003008595C
MSKKIKSIFIKSLFDSNDIYWKLKDVNVLVGKNGAGKSTILQLIRYTVQNKYNYDVFSSCEGSRIAFESETDEDSINVIFSPKVIKETFSKAFIKSNLNNLKNEFTIAEEDIGVYKIDKKLEDRINNFILKENIFTEHIDQLLDDNNVKINVEYISTINMTANSTQNIQKSDGGSASFLDYEINEELNSLIFSQNSENHKKKLISSLNYMFKDSNKIVSFKKNKLYFKLKNGKTIEYKSLSSGERQVIYIFIKVLNALDNEALILMDEPEISLHLSWQENLISEIRKLNDSSQLVIVTHSPAIVMNGWMDSFVDINEIIVE